MVFACEVVGGIVPHVVRYVMTPEMVTAIGREAIMAVLMLAGPMLFFALVVGLVISKTNYRKRNMLFQGCVKIARIRCSGD